MRANKLKYIAHRLEFEKNELIELLPEQLREEFKKEAYIAGGCVYSLYNNQEPKDFDFFIHSEDFAKRLREYFEDKVDYKSKNIQGGMYNDVALLVTDNAISLGKYQIITRWLGSPIEVIQEFDFAHLLYYYKKDKIMSVDDTYDALDSIDLKYNERRSRDIVGTLNRVSKFVSRGMRISQREHSKILLKLKETGFTERETEILEAAVEFAETDHFGS